MVQMDERGSERASEKQDETPNEQARERVEILVRLATGHANDNEGNSEKSIGVCGVKRLSRYPSHFGLRARS